MTASFPKGIFATLILLSTTLGAWANVVIDVYGVAPIEAQPIIKKYGKSVRTIEMQLAHVYDDSNHGIEHPDQLTALYQKKRKLIQAIQKEEHFTFVDIQTVTYPNKTDIFTTIEIIPNTHTERLQFVHHPTSMPHKSTKHDLITEMIDYHQKAIRLLMTQQIDLKDNSCPVYHCAVPFTHPSIKPYLSLFNDGMDKNKSEVIDALNHDSDPERRAAAAFLIGHLKDPHEIVNLLAPHINDPNTTVRNNVLRVIGETIWRAKIHDIDARPYMALLDSPYVTDRNKSLIILYTLADDTQGKKQIAANNHGKLEALASLKQPNNHDMAVQILQKINGLH
jgi:hypothetical protein